MWRGDRKSTHISEIHNGQRGILNEPFVSYNFINVNEWAFVSIIFFVHGNKSTNRHRQLCFFKIYDKLLNCCKINSTYLGIKWFYTFSSKGFHECLSTTSIQPERKNHRFQHRNSDVKWNRPEMLYTNISYIIKMCKLPYF